jgi:hypothetical protein
VRAVECAVSSAPPGSTGRNCWTRPSATRPTGTPACSSSGFGRRVRANGSAGTDHGTAGPVFLLGRGVRGGFHGRHPAGYVDDDPVRGVFSTDFPFPARIDLDRLR